ncbi:MAG: gamma-glutamyltransferase, partial [Candidatus Rokuibacteriota bacterium]
MTAATRLPEARSTRGMVASPHVLASRAGVRALESGGNALDAAIAAAATIAVVYPHMNGVGGDNVWLVYDAVAGRLLALNAAGRAVASVDPEVYRRRFGGAIPTRGGAAALTVPGVVSGWWEAHVYSAGHMASPLGWPALFEDAITHARDGIDASPSQHRENDDAPDLFEAGALDEVRRTLWPIYHPDRLTGGRLTQPDLARTLTAIADGGAEAFYRGALARRVAEGAASAGSPITREDLAAHRADWVEPLRIPYRGGEAASFPPPTQGFAALAILAMLDGFDVASLEDADHVHLIVEATKLAFEDRDRYLADPDFVAVPVARCLDPAYLAERRALISRRRARPSAGPPDGGGTVAIVTADARGNAVSLIQSLYWEYGSGVVAGDTGVILQNRGAFFSLDPAHPNALLPGKRTAHTLIPSMYLVGGRPRFVYGTMGGEGQPQTQAALVTRILNRGMSPQAAVEAPRWLLGRTWGEETRALRVESRFAAHVVESLQRRGHEVRVVEPWSDLMGHAHVISLA